MKKKFLFPFLCFILLLLIGIGLMLYPLISNWYGERVRSTVEVQYNEAIAKLEDESIREAFRAAQEYNESLYSVQLDPAAAVDEYDSLLNLSGNGIMGYVEIPVIDVNLPIYHTVAESSLQKGAGHMPGTSLPIGGKSTHAVISAHSGMSDARMFTDLDKVQKGDLILLHVLGDTLAEVLDWSGADVWREFYVNDFGNQIEKFAKSIEARYIQLIKGEDAIEFPEDGYHGDDIRELAKAFYDIHGDSYLEKSVEERHADMARFGLERNIPKMKSDLERYGIKFDEWFFESSLHNSGYVKDTVEELHKQGWTYEKDGALWLNTTQLLKEKYMREGKSQEQVDKLDLKDDVLRRANGFYTYFAADIAYHRNKFAVRHFDKVINIWGADHHGHVARMKGAMDALGLDGTNRLDIVLMQLVKLVRDGEVVRMSKRTGKTISLSDLLDEIPVDACRYFFNAKPDTQMEFDLGLAVREDSENPIYYIQYAHARICSLLKALEEEGHSVKPGAVDLSILSSDAEHALIKELSSFAEEIRMAARDYDPSYINRYLMRLAAAFHKFYNACRIKGEEKDVLLARLKLADTARAVLKNGMTLIGCSAPEKM